MQVFLTHKKQVGQKMKERVAIAPMPKKTVTLHY